MEICLLIISKTADVGNPKTPPPLASANIGIWGPPSPPKTCRRLKWMVPYVISGVIRQRKSTYTLSRNLKISC